MRAGQPLRLISRLNKHAVPAMKSATNANNPAPRRRTMRAHQFAIHKEIPAHLADQLLFEGMMLQLVGLPDMNIGVSAYYAGDHRVVGRIPKGMIHHLDDVLQYPYDYCVQLDAVECDRLEGRMWITIEPLNDSAFIDDLLPT